MPKSADSDSNTKKRGGSGGVARTKPWRTAEDVRWTLLDEDQLADAYAAVVEPALRQEGRSPSTDRPSYEWLSSNGFRGLTYALKEYHDMSFGEFWSETLGYSEEKDTGYDWDIEHEPTRESFEEWLAGKQSAAENWSDSTRKTVRYRLARYARSYREQHGTDDLLSPVAAESDITETEAVDRCRDTFSYMRSDFSGQTIARVHDEVRRWYDWLMDRRVATINPTDGAEDWFDWSRSPDQDAVALEPSHVRAMYDTAVRNRDRMMLIALAAWGLRAGEVAALHEDQLHLDEEEPYIEFEDRKNGPGSVAIVYGGDIARQHCTRIEGYLFPSDRSETGHVNSSTIANWFHGLADRAGVPKEIDGAERKPHMGRRFWFDAYTSTIEELVEHQIEAVADEQGSASASVVWEDYLTEDRRRELLRGFMREKLSNAFGSST